MDDAVTSARRDLEHIASFEVHSREDAETLIKAARRLDVAILRDYAEHLVNGPALRYVAILIEQDIDAQHSDDQGGAEELRQAREYAATTGPALLSQEEKIVALEEKIKELEDEIKRLGG